MFVLNLKNPGRKLRRWELALLLGVAIAALVGAWLDGQQAVLAQEVIRLHVIANSDTEEDQALKLKVRDRVLEEAETVFPENGDIEETAQAIIQDLPRLAAAGAQVVAQEGYDYNVKVSLEPQVWFPTKYYEDFALPAGNYRALRVTIGEGEGQNWWCVVFPPLCLGSVSESTEETAAAAGMDSDQIALMTGENEGYVVKFKALEIYNSIKEALS